MYGSYGGLAYSNSASGFATNVGYSTNGGNDTAVFFDSPGNDTFYAYADYNQQRPALGGHVRQLRRLRPYSNLANGFGTNVGYSTNGGSDTATFFDSAGNDTFYAYANYNNSGQPLAGMYGSYNGFGAYSNLADGFGTNLGIVDQRRQRHGRSVRFVRQRQQQRPLHGRGDRSALRERQRGNYSEEAFGVPGRQRGRPGRHEHPDQGAGPPHVSIEFARRLAGWQLRRIIHKL